MPTYRISFYKTLLSSDGHPSRCLQEWIDVPNSEDPDHAVSVASKSFEIRHGLRHWDLYADALDVALVTGGEAS
jgi:hypothetical protein